MEKEIIKSIFSQKEDFAVLGNADLYVITLFPRAGREGSPSVPAFRLHLSHQIKSKTLSFRGLAG